MDFDVGEVLAVGLVFHPEILCCDVADFTAVGGDVDFKDVFAVRESGVGDVDWDAREPLIQYLIMNAARIYGYS